MCCVVSSDMRLIYAAGNKIELVCVVVKREALVSYYVSLGLYENVSLSRSCWSLQLNFL